jgi:ABC-type iron transport system FetAB ATPase subunit
MDGDTRLLDDVSLTAAVPGRIAVVGPAGSGKSELAQLLCGLLQPTSGSITVGGRDLQTLSPEEIGHCFGYADQDSHVFTGSWRENLLYGLQHRPIADAIREATDAEEYERWAREADLAGNTTVDLQADWVDYAALGVNDRAGLDALVGDVIRIVGLETDLTAMGIRALPDLKAFPGMAEGLLQARRTMERLLAEADIADAVEVFNENRFNSNATVGENFLYGRPTDETFDVYHIGANDFVLDVLNRHDLLDWLVEIGRQTANDVIEMFQDVSSGDERLERLSLIPHEDMPKFQSIVMRADRDGIEKISRAERTMLLSLVFAQAPAHQRFGFIDEDVCARIVTARHTFRRELPAHLRDRIEFFDEQAICSGITVQCNVMFGRLAKSQHRAEVERFLHEAIARAGLGDVVLALGLGSSVGTAGSRLSPTQRQKLALARCLLKKPSVLIVNEAINALDREEQDRLLDRVVDYMAGRGLVWIDREGSDLHAFEQVLQMRAGRVVRIERRGAPDSVSAAEEAHHHETMDDVIRILMSAPILEGVAPSTAKILAYAGDQQRYQAGEVFLREGEAGEDCCFVLEGTAEVSVGEGATRQVVAALGPGEVIGETALLLDSPRSATVTARDELLILSLSRDLFCDLLRKDEQFGIAVMRTLAKRLVETTASRKTPPQEMQGGQA